jgi:hypothetical protein
MAEWLEDHMAAIGFLNSDFGIFVSSWITSDRAGPLDGKWR